MRAHQWISGTFSKLRAVLPATFFTSLHITNTLMTHSSLWQISKSFSRKLAKPLNASTALRAYRSRHLGTLMHCCEAWELVGKCFDRGSFECVDFHGLSQIIVSLTRERIAEREAEICNLPLGRRRKKTTRWRNAVLGLRAPGRTKKPMLCLHAVTD